MNAVSGWKKSSYTLDLESRAPTPELETAAPPGLEALNPLRQQEREFCIDNLLVRIRLIIETILLDRPCAVRVLNSMFRGDQRREGVAGLAPH
jgi:hypothetical protein